MGAPGVRGFQVGMLTRVISRASRSGGLLLSANIWPGNCLVTTADGRNVSACQDQVTTFVICAVERT